MDQFKSSTTTKPEEILPPPSISALVSREVSRIADKDRTVEVWAASSSLLLRIAGGSDLYIASGGTSILHAGVSQSAGSISPLDREILLGPALVLALALRGIWSLHASSVIFREKVFLFVGESGQGKSTLAAYLHRHPGWRLVADDIFPVMMDSNQVIGLPHFPQLKLPPEAQPGPALPEQLPIDGIFVLMTATSEAIPAIKTLPPNLATQVLLRHTAGTRLFTPELLGKHLELCALAAGQVPVHELTYPHRKDMLPKVRELLENTC